MDLFRMSHDDVRMIYEDRLQQLQAVILNEVYCREEFRLLSIRQNTNVLQDLWKGIRRVFSRHVGNTYMVGIQGRAAYCRRAVPDRYFDRVFVLGVFSCIA